MTKALTAPLAVPVQPVPLSAGTSALASAAIAPATRRAYESALTGLQTHLDGQPFSDAALESYIQHLADTGQAPATAAMAIAAVRRLASASGQAVELPQARAALAGFRRTHRERGRGQAQGVQWSQADSMSVLSENGGHSLAGIRDAAIVAVMSDALLRVSELAALDVCDLAGAEDGSGTVAVRYSKTDQDGEGCDLYLRPSTVRRVRRWMDAKMVARYSRRELAAQRGTARLRPDAC